METVVKDLEIFTKEAQAFAHALKRDAAKATLVTLSGELGAGKTAFVKAVAAELGVAEVVTSPTFVLEKIYKLREGGVFSTLIHIDAYRLMGKEELGPLNIEELIQEPQNLIMSEWPERVDGALPPPSKTISIKVESDGSRHIMYG